MKLDNKGHTYVDAILAMTILVASLLMVFQMLGVVKENKHKQDINIIVLQSINNESERAYRTENWETLSETLYALPGGVLESSFSEYHITDFDTESVMLTVSTDNFSQSVYLERSVYWNE